METLKRRAFLKGAGTGVLAFTIGGCEVFLTPREARAQGVPFRMLSTDEAKTLEAVGEALVPGARDAGVIHFVDQQISGPAHAALLEARILNVQPPYANFYRAVVGAIDRVSEAQGKPFAEQSASEQHDFIDRMRHNKLEGWQGPPQPFVYTLLRADAIDVVYGTMAGYEALGIPYRAHIAPTERW